MRREEDRGERKGLKDSGCGGQEGTGGPRSSPALNVHQGTERRNSLCSSSPTRQRLWRFSAWSFHLHRGRRVRLPSVLYDWEPRSALFLDEGRQGDASQLQQEDPPRVVQRGSHTLSRLLRHQIRGAKAYMLIEDVTGGAPRQPRNPSRLWRRRCTTSSSYAASVRWTAKTTETAMSSS